MDFNSVSLRRCFFGITIFTITIIFANNVVSAETFYPPYSGATTVEVASEADWIAGKAGFYSNIDTNTGSIAQYELSSASVLGGSGAFVGNAICKTFTVSVNGEYVIEFKGNVSYLLLDSHKFLLSLSLLKASIFL